MATAPLSSVACSKEEENYTRMHMIIQKVCHKVLREYLVKKVSNIGPGVSIDYILATNRTYITSGRNKRLYESRYFPLDANNQPMSTNLQDWDIQMLSFILTTFCNLLQAETDDIDFIREKRNNLSHLGKPEVADYLYTSFRIGVDGILKKMFSFLRNSKFEKEIKDDLEWIDNRLPEQLVDVYKTNHREYLVPLNDLQLDVRELRKEHLEHRSITDTNRELLKRILHAVNVLQEKHSCLPDDVKDKLDPPECSAGKILAKNCKSPQEEEMVTDALMQSFQRNGLNKIIESPLQSSVETIEKLYGPATSFERGCIEFAIQFNTLQSCLCYIDDVLSGKVDTIFGPVKDALRQSFENDNLELTVIMTEAQFGELIAKMCITLENALSKSETKSNEVIILPCKTDGLEVTNTQGPQIVAAIDIGSSYSGYAYSLGQTICTSKFVSGNSQLVTYKAPTKVLLTPNKLFHKFGFDAEAAYVELADEGEQREWFYFENIKMQLYQQAKFSRHMKIADVTGKTMEALTVLSMIFTYFKDEVIQKVNSMYGQFTNDDIRWVLTVPAICNDSAKSFMREAAEKAGIDGNHLQLGMEAEAGIIYCKTLPLQTSGEKSELYVPGCRFVVLDLGGRTVDVTAYEVRCDGTLDEIHKAGGGFWGGNMVNDAYMEMLWRIFGKDVVQKFQQENQEDCLNMQNEFELKKRRFSKADQTVRLRLPGLLIHVVKSLTGSTMPSLIKKSGMDGDISLKIDKLSVSGQMFSELFKTPIGNIVGYLHNLLDSAEVHNSIDMILLVGGFSQSPVVRNALQDAFPHTPIYCPEDAEFAVMKGAVIFGHMPSVITSRISRYSYGVAVMRDAKVGCPEQHLYTDPNGKLLMKNVFRQYTQVGECLNVDSKVGHNFRLLDGKRSVIVQLYSSSQNGIEFVTDSECTKIGEVMFYCSPSWQYYDELNILLSFGNTEITVQVDNLVTGETVRSSFKVF